MAYVRRSARVVLVGPARAVQLVKSGFRRPLRGVSAAWFVPGGGVELGETVREAAVRELWEETGLVVQSQDLVHLAFAEGDGQVGDVSGPMRDDLFVTATPSGELSSKRLEAHEREAFVEYRWWPLEDLLCTDEVMFPGQLAPTLRQYLDEPMWPEPIRLPW